MENDRAARPEEIARSVAVRIALTIFTQREGSVRMTFTEMVAMVVRQPMSTMWTGASVVALSVGLLLVRDFRRYVKGGK